MDVAVGRGCPPVAEQAPGDMQAFPVHDRMGSVRMPQVMQARIRHDAGRIPRLDPELVERTFGQRFVSVLAGEYPFPGSRIGETFQQFPRRLAEQNVPRPGLAVAQGEPVGLDLRPAQAAYLARPAPGQQEQAHRRDADRVFGLALAQDRAEPRKVVRTEQPPARRTAVTDDTGARVSSGFGPMASRDGAVEHVAQDVMPSRGHVQIFRTVPLANTMVRRVGKNAFAVIVPARPCPVLGRPIHHGAAPSITARYFSAGPSDSTSRWTPCPPVVFRQ